MESLETDGVDPIDSRLGGGAGVAPSRWLWQRHALGLASSPVPAFAALLAGLLIGPRGLGILTPEILRAVEPVMAAATVALGVLIGLDLGGARSEGEWRLAVGAAIEGSVTLLCVAAAFTVVAQVAGWEWLATPYLALLLGVAAAASSVRTRGSDGSSNVARLGDLDDLIPVLVGAGVLLYVGGESIRDRAELLGLTVGLTATVAVAGALLVASSSTEGERRVYTAGSVLLLAGLAAALSASTLFVGALAAAAWNRFIESARDSIARDAAYLQHPLVVFVLVIAGAEAAATTPVIALGAMFALVRLAGKAAGGALAAPLVPGAGRWFGLSYLPPGVAGLAAVLMVVYTARIGTPTDVVVGIAVWGAIVSDLLAMLVPAPEAEA